MEHGFEHVGIIGAGQMGHGIAQVAAGAGFAVTLCDSSEEALARAVRRIESATTRLVSKSLLTEPGAGRAAISRPNDGRHRGSSSAQRRHHRGGFGRGRAQVSSLPRARRALPGAHLAAEQYIEHQHHAHWGADRPCRADHGDALHEPRPPHVTGRAHPGPGDRRGDLRTRSRLWNRPGQGAGYLGGLPGLYRQPRPHPNDQRSLLCPDGAGGAMSRTLTGPCAWGRTIRWGRSRWPILSAWTCVFRSWRCCMRGSAMRSIGPARCCSATSEPVSWAARAGRGFYTYD